MLAPDMSTPSASDAGPRDVDVLTTVAVQQVTPSVRRVTLNGDAGAVAGLQPTINLLVPRVGDPSPRWPAVARDGRIVWPAGSHGVSLRSYTARRQDPASGEVDVDFVLHGDGPAAAWAAAARPGSLLAIAGSGPLGFSPAPTVLLAADETARPAVARILADVLPGTRGTALLEVADAPEEQELTVPPGVQICWLHRGGTPPGESTLLVDAVAALARPEGAVFAWVGAESATVRAV